MKIGHRIAPKMPKMRSNTHEPTKLLPTIIIIGDVRYKENNSFQPVAQNILKIGQVI